MSGGLRHLRTKVAFQVEVGNDRDGWVAWGEPQGTTGIVARVANEAERTYKGKPTLDVRVVRITTTREEL